MLAVLAGGHEVISTRLTWSKEISRIVYRRCASCHRPDGQSKISLLSYAEARPWAKAIKDEVLSRRMPPWGAVKGFGPLADDPSLTQEEIDRIAQWVEGGAPEGDAAFLPPVPVISRSSQRRLRQVPLASAAGGMLAGLQPLADVADARVVAELPDGRILPLLWLHGYKAQWKRSFLFTEPLRLPPATRVRVEPAVPLAALTPARRRTR